MNDQELLILNENGLIPGPGESEENFFERVAKTKKKFAEGEKIPEAHWDWTREYLKEFFDVKPLYITAFYSNRSLAPWQGAASWIEGRELCAVQLREGLRKGSYLGIYRREEILAHEAVHAVRSSFDEDRCEEFFAYMTSEKRWRRVLGPIFQRPWEVWPFLMASLGGAVFPICYLGAAVWVGIGFWRLICQHGRLRRAARAVLQVTGDARKTRAILFRLTDREIERFASGESVRGYAERQKCLRWKVIRLAYFR